MTDDDDDTAMTTHYSVNKSNNRPFSVWRWLQHSYGGSDWWPAQPQVLPGLVDTALCPENVHTNTWWLVRPTEQKGMGPSWTRMMMSLTGLSTLSANFISVWSFCSFSSGDGSACGHNMIYYLPSHIFDLCITSVRISQSVTLNSETDPFSFRLFSLAASPVCAWVSLA